ncbi:hypothetical protein BDN71DRAFT_174473 [Pleurotus eryngii]|uniref:Uncharacterized protein n=1 Tax=Pleurotus eryngii TaxID=5323 RepID=A0A9P6A920_PLEER|nr:hypothetical protein BDN71DRAFT_174473 [Pleurotus eryngii]
MTSSLTELLIWAMQAITTASLSDAIPFYLRFAQIALQWTCWTFFSRYGAYRTGGDYLLGVSSSERSPRHCDLNQRFVCRISRKHC